MRFLSYDKVLCLSPHPDDIEISMSGLIRKYVDTKFYIYCMSYGTSTDNTSDKSRLKEADLFWQLIGAPNVEIIPPYKNAFEEITSAEWMTNIDTIVNELKPKAIFTPPQLDSHQEHRFVNDMVYVAIRSKPISFIEYKSASVTNEWTANYFVDITRFFDEKVVCLRKAFSSQIDSRYFSTKCLTNFHVDYVSSKKGIDTTEQFNIKVIYDNDRYNQ